MIRTRELTPEQCRIVTEIAFEVQKRQGLLDTVLKAQDNMFIMLGVDPKSVKELKGNTLYYSEPDEQV